MRKAAAAAKKALAKGPLSRTELKPYVESSTVWNGVNALYDVLRVPPSGTWERRRADVYAMAADWLGPIAATEEEGLELLLKRYLAGFGPGRLADAASWAGVPAKKLQPAAEKLRPAPLRGRGGQGAPRPPARPLPERRRSRRRVSFPSGTRSSRACAPRRDPRRGVPPLDLQHAKTPQSVNTFLVDGAVAGKWSVKAHTKKAELLVEPFEKLSAKAKKELQAEGERLVRFHEPDAETHTVRLAGSA